MTTDDTWTLGQWAELFQQGFRWTADKEGLLMAILLLPFYPWIAALAGVLAQQQPIEADDTEKVSAAKERDIEDFSELKSR